MSVETSMDALSSGEISQVKKDELTVDSVINWQLPLLAILFVSVVFVSIKTVVHRHESRTAYVKLQTLEKERDKLAAQWSRLKLEQATTLNQVRVEQYARWDLNMKMPKASEKMIIQEPASAGVAVASEAGKTHSVKVSGSVTGKTSKVALGN
ncbi:MAG: cell division protein FtsL [Cocleimonas sp.]